MAERAFKVVMGLENAVFEEDAEAEVARILRSLAECVEIEGLPEEASGPLFLRDINGNTVGAAVVSTK